MQTERGVRWITCRKRRERKSKKEEVKWPAEEVEGGGGG